VCCFQVCVPSRWTGMSKSAASVGWPLDPSNLQPTATVNAGDRSAEINQVIRSHALSTLVHLDAQPEPDLDSIEQKSMADRCHVDWFMFVLQVLIEIKLGWVHRTLRLTVYSSTEYSSSVKLRLANIQQHDWKKYECVVQNNHNRSIVVSPLNIVVVRKSLPSSFTDNQLTVHIDLCVHVFFVKKVKGGIHLFIGNPSQSYGASSAVWNRTVLPATRHRWTRPRLNPGQIGRYSIYLPRRDGRLSWPTRLITYRDCLTAYRQSPIQVLTRPGVEQLRWSDTTYTPRHQPGVIIVLVLRNDSKSVTINWISK